MRVLPIALFLTASAAFAQLGAPYKASAGPERTWTLGAQTFGPTLTGHFLGKQDGKDIVVDLDADLGLGKDKATPGFFLDYQGPRFAFQVSSGTTEYKGDRVVNRIVTINGVAYSVGSRVQSRVKLAAVDGTWTIKFVSDPSGWLGLDLGVKSWTLDMDAAGTLPLPASQTPTTASTRVTAPIPQIGLSGGTRGYNGAVEAKAYVHYLAYKQAKYTLIGADVRVFPVKWFGLRAFYEGGKFDVPKGSVKDDLEFVLDCKGVGLGAVVRF
ncbi:MAG: hypothetical protein HGB30_00795 [Holophagaceae bacterium]|nr:hypothetical protein [Holophagaceae bacterium]